VIPILGRLEYLVAPRRNLTLSLGTGWGGYILYSMVTTTQSQVYVQDYDPWREGNIQRNAFKTQLCTVTPGGEASIGATCEIDRQLSLGLTAKMIITSKVRDQWESSGYYSTDWDPAQPELITITEGYQYGGFGWGLGMTVTLGIP
jgi:hypothetical protein